MTTTSTSPRIANPFYATRRPRLAPRVEARDRPVYARLPHAPRNASPVPHLTSLYHHADPGPWGDRSYPGNCSGNLIRDLVRFFAVSTCYVWRTELWSQSLPN
jgi:hypothetical protein